jgi:methylmalonyl-CoA mutase cobalamin-binding subunit
MLNKNQIEELLEALNVELLAKDAKGEIGIVGGSALCLVFNARKATKDVDAIFEPSSVIRKAAENVAIRYNVDHDWLNDVRES